jgi:trk system potassium uptake protein TrkA
MKIVIVGSGEIGTYLARILAQEHHDIVVIDVNPDNLRRVGESLDVLTVEGSATRLGILQKAGVQNADIIIAVTSSEEVNFVACMLAARLGVRKKIMRVRDPEFLFAKGTAGAADFGIDLVIYPEGIAAMELVRLIRRSAATEVLDLADGRMQLLGLKIDPDSPLIGKKLEDIPQPREGFSYRVVCILRGVQTIIPKHDSVIRKGDQIFVISRTAAVPEMLEVCGKSAANLSKIMILGGGEIGQWVARELEDEMEIKLIESSLERSQKLATSLRKTLILHDEGKDLDLLASEGIMRMDAYIAVSPDEEGNIISCLMAKHLGVKKTVSLVEKVDYIPFSNAIGVDALINKKLSAATAILKFIRKGEIVTAATLHGVGAEIIELVAQPGSRVTKKPVGELGFPDGARIGCIVHADNVFIPVRTSRVHPQDRVVVFTLPKAIHDVERLFH